MFFFLVNYSWLHGRKKSDFANKFKDDRIKRNPLFCQTIKFMKTSNLTLGYRTNQYKYGVTINGYKICDVKIKTLGTPTAGQQVNTSHFTKKLASQLEKKTQNPYEQDLKIQCKIHFLTVLNIGRNAQKNQSSKYIVLYEKNAFRFNFGPQEVPQPENA